MATETKADKARGWLRAHPDGMLMEFVAATKVEMHSSQFSALKAEIKEEHRLAKAAATRKANKAKNGAKQVTLLEARVAELEEEVAYQDWRHVGEKAGFVLRLLREEAGEALPPKSRNEFFKGVSRSLGGLK
jgi:hypothetical protein